MEDNQELGVEDRLGVDRQYPLLRSKILHLLKNLHLPFPMAEVELELEAVLEEAEPEIGQSPNCHHLEQEPQEEHCKSKNKVNLEIIWRSR